MLTVPGSASGPQGMKSTERGADTAATELRGGDAEDVETSGTIVTMRGGGDSRPRNHRRHMVNWQQPPPNTSSMRPDQRGRSDQRGSSIAAAGRVTPSQRQSASAQQTPNARG